MINTHPTKCNICGGRVIYTSNSRIYGREYGSGYCYLCQSCGAYVGTHKPRPREAFGILADERMRNGKKMCHSLFDPLWQGKPKARKKRKDLYAWLAIQMGICIRTDEGKSYILSESPAANVENWKWLKTPDCAVVSVNGMTGAVSLAASDVEAVPNSRKINGKSLAADVTLNAQDVNARSSDWTPTASDVGAEPLIRNALADTSVADADTMPFTDASASMATKKITFANLKSVLKSYFDGLYNKYVHPAYPENAKGLYKIASDTTGHVSEATAVTKADITALGIPEQDTVYVLPAATVTQRGGVKVGAGLSMDGDVMSVGTIDGGSF